MLTLLKAVGATLLDVALWVFIGPRRRSPTSLPPELLEAMLRAVEAQNMAAASYAEVKLLRQEVSELRQLVLQLLEG